MKKLSISGINKYFEDYEFNWNESLSVSEKLIVTDNGLKIVGNKITNNNTILSVDSLNKSFPRLNKNMNDIITLN